MNPNIEFNTIAGRQCYVFLPSNYKNEDKAYPVVYMNGDEATYSLLKEVDYLSSLSYIMILIISEDRLNEMTPWPSPSLHIKFPDFGGRGDEYINYVEHKLKPMVDQTHRTLPSPESTGLIGYSLGGLITIYAAYHTNSFGCFASMSGSFWYPDFVYYTLTHQVLNRDANLYLSSGDREGVGHKDIKKDAVSCTNKIYDNLVNDLSKSRITINWDEGGHHSNGYERYKNALLWLNQTLIFN